MLITITPENVDTLVPAGIKITDSPAPENTDEPPARQAFYKIRSAIAASQSIDKTAIRPDSPLETFFPRRGRRQRIRAFQSELGIEVELTIVKSSMEWAIILSAAASFIALFFSWKVMTASLALTAALTWLAVTFGQKLECLTIAQLADKMGREYYRKPWTGTTGGHKKEMNSQSAEPLFVDFYLQPL